MARPKNYVRQDDREWNEKDLYPNLIVGTDTFMSGWGGARGGLSVAAWACKDADVPKVFAWVKGRSDMRRVGLHRDSGGWGKGENYYPPKSTAHFHIYKVLEGHPALAAS